MKSEFLEIAIVDKFIQKFNLNFGTYLSGTITFTYFYNKNIFIELYIEKGWLELSVVNLKNWRWNRAPIDSYIPEIITHKEFFNSISQTIPTAKNMNEQNNNYLHYYISFIIDYLPEIFEGDFSKIEKNMEVMNEWHISKIQTILNGTRN